MPSGTQVQAYISNRFSVLADEDEQDVAYDLQTICGMKRKQLVSLAKSLDLIGFNNKKKKDLCLLIANTLGINEIEENLEIDESTITFDMTIASKVSIPKKRAMTSEKASRVKRQGHKNQERFASLMKGVKSEDHTGKIDVRVQEKTYSLKKECKRIQFALYTISSRRWRNMSSMTEMCKLCLSVLPEKFKEYKSDTQKYKKLIGEKMTSLKETCQDKSKLKELLEIFIRGRSNEVRFLGFNYKGEDYIFQADEMIDNIVQNTTVVLSSKKGIHSEDAQKVIIRNEHNIIEMEIRKSCNNHYREFLCTANRDKLLNLLMNVIVDKKYLKNKVLLLGKAIEQHS